MNRYVLCGLVMGLLTIPAVGGHKQGGQVPSGNPLLDQAAKEPAVMETVTVTGKISKEEGTRVNKKGMEVTVTKYTLTDADGRQIVLPSPNKKQAGGTDLEPYVGKQVKITGQGIVRHGNKGDRPVVKVVDRVEDLTPKAE